MAVVGGEAAIEAEGLPARDGYLVPFRLRALGLARGDDRLIAQADERFRGLHLDWHAAQTEAFGRLRAAFA